MALSPYDVNKRTDKQWYDDLLAWIIVPPIMVAFILYQLRGRKMTLIVAVLLLLLIGYFLYPFSH